MNERTAILGMSRDIPLALIDADPNQPRQNFNQAQLEELAASLREAGQVVPIMVRPVDERFIIVHGERRWRAAQLVGWETIRAEVRELDSDEARWLALVENVQRADLTPMEEARAFQARLGEGMTQTDLGQRIGKSQSYIAQKLRLLNLPAPIALYVDRGLLTEGHARQLLRLEAIYHGAAASLAGAEEWGQWPDEDTYIFVFALLRDLRPEDQPPGYFPMLGSLKESGDLLADGCRALCEYVMREDGQVPLWTLTAFWWGSMAAVSKTSVALLGKAIDGWRDRMHAAIFWWLSEGRNQPHPQEPSPRAQLWWSYTSDLRHGRLLELLRNDALPDGFLAALRDIAETGTVPLDLPSNMQHWGTHAAVGQELAS